MKNRKFLIEEKLKKLMQKLYKKDSSLYNSLINKMEEIIISEDVTHYKNLRKPYQRFKRVHIKGSFVLLFKYDEKEDKIAFFDIEHHDRVYK